LARGPGPLYFKGHSDRVFTGSNPQKPVSSRKARDAEEVGSPVRLEKKEIIGGLACLGFGAWLLYQTFLLDVEVAKRVGGGVGADGYPFLLAVATIGLAIFLTLQAVFGRERQTPAEAPGIQGNEPPVFKRAVWCFLSVVIYTALLLPIGYLITTPILLVVLMRILGDRRWVVPLVNALLLTLGIFVAFRYGVNIVLPEGVLGNLSN